MATVDRVLPWRRHAPIAGRRDRSGGRRLPASAIPRRRSARSSGPTRWRPRRTSTSTARAARSTSTTRSRWPRSSPTSGSTTPPSPPRCSTTPSRTPEITTAEIEERFGAEVAADRRRGHQARADPLRLQGGAAGRHHAQDAGGDGQGPAGPDHQAGRPAAQHADHRGDAAREAGAPRPGDARHLRAAGPPPRACRRSSSSSRTSPSPPSTPSATPRSTAWSPLRTPERDHYLAEVVAEVQGASGRAEDRGRGHRPAASTSGASTRRWCCGARSSTTSSTWWASGSSSTR